MHPAMQAIPSGAAGALGALRRATLETVQVNLGYRCNLSCVHCHVSAGPHRKEMMSAATVELLVAVLRRRRPRRVDLTGGAPELHPAFRRLVSAARRLGVEVIDRCNLTVLDEPGQEDTAEFLAAQRVAIIASLPCYDEGNVAAQRGKRVYERSIAALRRLNALGYGREDGLALHLVHNPLGPSLPPPQAELEARYRRELGARFGIAFNSLYTIANMPIGRFARVLRANGEYDAYMRLLARRFNADTLPELMCRRTVSVDWRGRLYDCDFNQMLGLATPRAGVGARSARLADLLDTSLEGRPIATDSHCLGCTAGAGSSCGGALRSSGDGAR